MKIQLIRNEDCHIWQTAEENLKQALSEAKLPQDYEIVVVKNGDEAKEYKFFGSPQITIEGKDIDPKAKKVARFQVEGCRFYLWEAEGPGGTRRGKMYEYPPKDMILEALQKR